MRRSLALLLLALAAAFPPSAAAAQKRTVPRGFAGVVAETRLFNDPDIDPAGELDRMVKAGVESVRFEIAWRSIQPYQSFAATPPDERGRFADEGGVPTDWARVDVVATLAAERRLSLLPIVLGAPAWATARHSGDLGEPPSSPETYARFMAALAKRYGTRGSFWDAHPELPRMPIKHWQVWNEPSLGGFWREQPFAPGYVRLLRAAHDALRDADPSSRVVLAGLPNRSWQDLARIYRQPGARRAFDVVALHPFTEKVANTLVIVKMVRRVMARHGDRRKPVWATEVSWPSARGKLTSAVLPWDTTERVQALKVKKVYERFGRERTRRRLRVGRVFWFSWLTEDRSTDYSFDYSGLHTIGPNGPRPKPAFAAFRRTALKLEGCRSKGSTAASCRR
jgi:hypothetical protein